MLKVAAPIALALAIFAFAPACGDGGTTVSSDGYALTVESVSSPSSYDAGPQGGTIKPRSGAKLVRIEVALQFPAEAGGDGLSFEDEADMPLGFDVPFALIDTEGASSGPVLQEMRFGEGETVTATLIFGVPDDAEIAQLKWELSSVLEDVADLVVDF